MSLTPAQLSTLGTAITNDATMNAFPNDPDGNFALTSYLNTVATPDFYIWRNQVNSSELFDVLNYTTYIGRSAGERDAFGLLAKSNFIDPSKVNIRSGINDIFSGAGGSAQRTAFEAIFKRPATRVEKIFSTGTGSSVSPANCSVFGTVSLSDVNSARNL